MAQPLEIYPSYYDEDSPAMWRYPHQKLKRPGRLSVLVVVILCIGVILTVLNIYQLQQMKLEHSQHEQRPITFVEPTPGKGASRAPVVWINGRKMETGYLKHVRIVFERLGFVITDGDMEWDVMWAHDYPFKTYAKIITALKPHQRVNHFPGSGFITNKVSLATSESRAIPTAFKIPKDKAKFLEHAKQYPEKLWVQKNNNHRGIKIKKIEELDLESEGSFVQEFVSKPFLIDERKFDIGVYTIMTSVKPLRLYVLHDEALIRFCGEPYHPFDQLDVNKYVVTDNYKPMWEMPSLKDTLINKRYSFKDTFNDYVRRQGKNATEIWNDIYDTIRNIFLEKEASLLSAGSKYKTTRNFFEMVRFDFVLDETGHVYLMEVNMSPNLSTGHFSGNRRLYEHVIYNTLRVARVASMVENQFHEMSKEDEEMLVSDKEISVFPEFCTLEECEANCAKLKCQLCSPCVNSHQRAVLKDAYLEHTNRGGCRRVFPPPINHQDALRWNPENDMFKLSEYKESDKIMYMWFIGMCKKDATWCI